MQYITEEYDHSNVLFYFEQLSKIPHGSGNVQGISNSLASFAREHNVRYIQDEAYNIIMFLPATPGMEGRKTIMLQGHMDMVCEKPVSGTHDFLRDPLSLYVKDGILHADGTTLGGDDGIAIAYMMAIVADTSLAHPALELVMTTDEETGMFGAAALDTSVLSASYLVNLDSEEEGFCFLGCAGGMRQNCEFPLVRENIIGTPIDIKIRGLLGGHSGVEIDKNRTNANKLMARVLFDLHSVIPFSLVNVAGGKMDNAIPRECTAEILVPSYDEYFFVNTASRLVMNYRKELDSSEPGLQVEFSVGKDEKLKEAVCEESFSKLLFFLLQAPDGIRKMSGDVKGLVESSLNMGVLFTTRDNATVRFSLRSSVSSYKYHMSDVLRQLVVFAGGQSSTEGDYPAWEYREDSKLRETYKKLYVSEYGKEPVFQVMHAGLECGLLFDKMKNLDIISIGPDMRDVHTPNETLDLASAVRVYKFLEKLLVML